MFDQVERFGKYTLVERLAVGGMAEIFRATVQGMSGVDRVVAIKRLHRHLGHDDGLVKMLMDEARLATQLRHPNVGQVFDLGCVDKQHFLVMEYIPGVDMHRLLRRLKEQQRLLPTAMTMYVMVEMLAGLHYAHELSGMDGQPLHVVHRDISPQNIMFSTQGEIKLIDFGIAKARSQMMHTQAGIIKGKFYYMSPEQAHGQSLDRRCDVYSAGMVMYELLTGRPAYEEAGDIALLRKVRACDFEKPSHWNKDLDPNLEKIVMRALHKDLRQRFQSAQDFRAALKHYAQHHFPPMSRQQAASFLKQVLEPQSLKKVSNAGDLMRREDFSATEDSLIFDASHLAVSMEGRAVSRNQVPQAPRSFADQLSPDENPFAAADEPTYVYNSAEDENPFAIPDELAITTAKPPRRSSNAKEVTSRAPIDEITTPEIKGRGRKPPRRKEKARDDLMLSPSSGPAQSIRIGPPKNNRPPKPSPAPPVMAHAAITANNMMDVVDDSTLPRHTVPASMDFDDLYEPSFDPNYEMPADLIPPSSDVWGGKEVTQITKPERKALGYGFRTTGEDAAFGASPNLASANGAHMGQQSSTGGAEPSQSLLDKAKVAVADPSSKNRKVLLASVVGVGLVLGILVPSLFFSKKEEPTTKDVIKEDIKPAVQKEDSRRRVTLSINTNPPGAQILIDGAYVGVTPYSVSSLYSDDVPKITLRLKGYETWEEEHRMMNTPPDPLKVELVKEAPRGRIVVNSSPSGLPVKIDGKDVGVTPFTLEDADRSKHYSVAVLESADSSVSKIKNISWSESDPVDQVFDAEFQVEQGDSDLPPVTTQDKKKSTRKSSRRRRTRRTPRRTTKSTADTKTTSGSEDKSLNVWGNSGSKSDSKSGEKSDSLNIWGNNNSATKSSSDDAQVGYVNIRLIDETGKIYIDGKVVGSGSKISKKALSPGSHKVKAYFTKLKRYSAERTVKIQAGKTRTITLSP